MLGHRVRLLRGNIRHSELAVYRPGVDAPVDPQQRHADVLGIVVHQGPEAAVGVAILRADLQDGIT